jgi:hypothetical protein
VSFSPFFTSYFQRRRTLSVAVDCCDCPEVMENNKFGEILFSYDNFKVTSFGPMIEDFWVPSHIGHDCCHSLNGIV